MRFTASRRILAASCAVIAVAALTTACSPASPAYTLPPEHGTFSYQLGGPYQPPANTEIVIRDRSATPADGDVYNVCYVNVLQTQPDGSAPDASAYGTTAWWVHNHPSLLLNDGDGDLVIDDDWNEALFDVSSATNRDELIAIQREWIAGCAEAGFDAIEPDNIDANERADGLLTHADIRAYMTLVVTAAHDAGLAVAQKNAIDPETGFGSEGTTFIPGTTEGSGFDFAVVEECGAFDECGNYAAVYGQRVYDIEYEADGFVRACENFDGQISIERRDLDLETPESADYVEERC